MSCTKISQDQNSLDNVLIKLGIGSIGDGTELPYRSNVIFEGKIKNDTLSGKIKLMNDELINVKVIVEEKMTIEHFDKLVYKWDDILREKLSTSKFDEIKRQLAEKVTKATYSQSRNVDKNFMQEKTEELFHALSLSGIVFYDTAVSFIFNSTVYHDFTINGMFNRNLKFVEVIIE